MANPDPHTHASFAYALLLRDSAFRRRHPQLRNVFVCVESDLLVDVRREATEHFPKGGEIACYFPERKQIWFVRHAGRGKFPNAGEVIDVNEEPRSPVTIGMVVDALTQDPNRMDLLTEVSTLEVEKRATLG
jgi:hypothetical protein